MQQAIVAAIRLPSTIQKLSKDKEQTIEGEQNFTDVTANNEEAKFMSKLFHSKYKILQKVEGGREEKGQR